MDWSEWVGKQVLGTTGPGAYYGRGKVISYCDAPTFQIERSDGQRFTWRCDQCELVQTTEERLASALRHTNSMAESMLGSMEAHGMYMLTAQEQIERNKILLESIDG